MRCQFSQEYPDQPCFCSACHLSSELFPRRQDGKIVLPVLPTVGVETGSPPRPQRRTTIPKTSASAPFQHSTPLMPEKPPQVPSVQPPSGENPNHPPRARSNVRNGPSARLRSNGTDSTLPEIPFSRAKSRPRSHSHSYITTTTAVSNPYPIPTDPPAIINPYPRQPIDPPTPETASTSASNSNSITPIPTLPSTLKFCPPFVACDRIAISPDSDAAKEGVTMIPWSVRRRKQKYRSGFDNGTGQGRGKTMFRYYGPDNDPNSSSKKR